MFQGYTASAKELKNAGINFRKLCPICFTNEIESDMQVEILDEDPQTV